MVMYKIQEEAGEKVMKECLRLGQMHYDEVYEDKKDKVPRNWNWQFLKICNDNHLLHMVTTRDEEGKMVGYFVVLVSPDMLSSTFKAEDLAIFVHPDHRGNGVWSLMLAKVEELLTTNGVASMTLKFQAGFNDQLPVREGYKLREYLYEKILVEEEPWEL